MYPVQKPYDAVIDAEPLMVRVVLPRRPAEEVVPAVHGGRLEQHETDEGPGAQHVRAQQGGREHDGQGVGDEVLNRVGVLGGQGDGGGELVVRLVDGPVEARGVQEAVGVVEEDLAHENAKKDVPRQLGRGGRDGGYAESGGPV